MWVLRRGTRCADNDYGSHNLSPRADVPIRSAVAAVPVNNNARDQVRYLGYEVKGLVHGHPARWATVWFTQGFWVLATYRLDRYCFLRFRPVWPAVRAALSPALFLLSPWIGDCAIHYRASIGRGLRILHPNLGVVVSANAVIGENCIFVGGNCVGSRPGVDPGELRIGNNVLLGANAVVLAPVDLGNDIRVGAGAVVMGTHPAGCTLVGVPAQARLL